MPGKAPWLRLRQGAILLGGALILPLLTYGPLGEDWTPAVVGGVVLLALVAEGRSGGVAWRVLVLAACVATAVVLPAPQAWTLALGLAGAGLVLTAVGRPRDGETPRILD